MLARRDITSAFEVEGDIVKLAQVSAGRTPQLHRLAALKAASGAPDDIAKAIRTLSTEHKVGSTDVILSIPRSKVTVKNIRLPSMDPREIEKMAGLQAAKQLPFPPEKIVFGYLALDKDDTGYTDILMALAHRNAIDNLLTILNQADIYAEKLILSSEALYLWHRERLKEEAGKGSILAVDIGRIYLEILVIKNGRLDFTRSVMLPQAEDIQTRIAEEIRNSLFTYEKETQGGKIDKMILTGRQSVLNKEAPALKREFSMPMVYIDAVRSSPREEGVKLPNDAGISSDSFTSLISAAFNAERLETNLIPAEIRSARILKLMRESFLISIALSLSLLIGVGAIVMKNFMDKRRSLAAINKLLDASKPQVKNLTVYRDVTEIVKSQLALTGSSVDIIRELYSRVPKEISLSIIDYEEGKNCLLRGVSEKLSDVFKFVSTLEESPYFENVKVNYATKRAIKNTEITDFEIVCGLQR